MKYWLLTLPSWKRNLYASEKIKRMKFKCFFLIATTGMQESGELTLWISARAALETCTHKRVHSDEERPEWDDFQQESEEPEDEQGSGRIFSLHETPWCEICHYDLQRNRAKDFFLSFPCGWDPIILTLVVTSFPRVFCTYQGNEFHHEVDVVVLPWTCQWIRHSFNPDQVKRHGDHHSHHQHLKRTIRIVHSASVMLCSLQIIGLGSFSLSVKSLFCALCDSVFLKEKLELKTHSFGNV